MAFPTPDPARSATSRSAAASAAAASAAAAAAAVRRRRRRRPAAAAAAAAVAAAAAAAAVPAAAAVGGGGRRRRRRRRPAAAAVAAAVAAAASAAAAAADDSTPAYLVNPIRDHALRQPARRSSWERRAEACTTSRNNLKIPFTNTQCQSDRPARTRCQGAGATLGIAFLSDLEVYLFLTAAQGDTRTNVLQAPKVTTFNGAAGHDLQRRAAVVRRVADPDRRARLGGVRAHAGPAPQRRHPDRHAGRLGRPAVRANDAQPVLQHDRRLHHDPGSGGRRRQRPGRRCGGDQRHPPAPADHHDHRQRRPSPSPTAARSCWAA